MSSSKTKIAIRQRLDATRDRDRRMTASELAEFRNRIGLTQAEFARETGWSLTAIRQWEQGLRLVPVFLAKLVEHWDRNAGNKKAPGNSGAEQGSI